MLCKKCGANIEDNSKFCGYCGNAIEISDAPQTGVTDSAPVQENVVNENVDLGQTMRIEPIQSVAEEKPVEQPTESFNNLQQNNVHMPVNETVVQTPLEPNSNVQQPVSNQAIENTTVMQGGPSSINNKKNNKLLFIIGGAVLAVVAVALVVFAFMKSSDNPIAILEKAINNIYNKGETSATVDAALSVSTTTGESFSFSLTVKTEAENSEKYKTQMTLNKSLFFEEMNAYATIDKSEMTIYLESSLVDMLGMTSSIVPTWLYYVLPLDDTIESEITEMSDEEIKLQDLIDKKHFEYVDELDGLKHYVLIIDQKLIDNMKSKLDTIEDEEINEMLNSMETLEETIRLDFYITTSNELSRIKLNMTEFLEDTEGISEFVISMSFSDLGNTKVEIPSAALNSKVDLQTYIVNNSTDSDFDYATNDNFEYDYGYGSDTDSDWDYTVDGEIGDLEFGI